MSRSISSILPAVRRQPEGCAFYLLGKTPVLVAKSDRLRKGDHRAAVIRTKLFTFDPEGPLVVLDLVFSLGNAAFPGEAHLCPVGDGRDLARRLCWASEIPLLIFNERSLLVQESHLDWTEEHRDFFNSVFIQTRHQTGDLKAASFRLIRERMQAAQDQLGLGGHRPENR